jgi:hypothetical protein
MASEAAAPPSLTLLSNSRDRERRPGGIRIEPGTPIGPNWEVDLVPLAAAFDDNPAARPAVNLIVSDDLVLAADIITQPPAEYGEIAAIMAAEVERTANSLGQRPRIVETRYPALATALTPLLRPLDILAGCGPVPGLDRAYASLQAHMLGSGGRGRISSPQRWAGWGWDPETIAALFREMAAYHRAAPWKVLADDEVLTINVGDKRTWHAAVMGQGEETYGLALYADENDIEILYSSDGSGDVALPRQGMVISVTYDPFDQLPRGMHREIRAAGWEVAGRNAHPVLFAMNTPGGGITREQLGDLEVALRAIPAFLAAHRDAFEKSIAADVYPAPIMWTDPASGAKIGYIGSWRVELPTGLWPVPHKLEISETTGKGARPGERLGTGATRAKREQAEQERLARFFAWVLTRPGGASLAAQEKAARSDLKVAADYVSSLMVEGVTVRGMNEHDLRIHLYGNYALEARRNANHEKMLASLARFFDFLEVEEEIVCPWAWPILADVERLAIRAASAPRGDGDAEDAGWYGELIDDLALRLLRPAVEVDLLDPSWDAERELDWLRGWLARRDEIIRGGESRPARVLELLIEGEKPSN